jgi:hypothetical protein
MNNENKYQYINKLPKEYHRVFWNIMIKAEANTFVDVCEKLTKNDCKIIMRYLYKITQENKQLREKINNVKDFCKRYLSLNLEAFDTDKLLEKILEILGDKENE